MLLSCQVSLGSAALAVDQVRDLVVAIRDPNVQLLRHVPPPAGQPRPLLAHCHEACNEPNANCSKAKLQRATCNTQRTHAAPPRRADRVLPGFCATTQRATCNIYAQRAPCTCGMQRAPMECARCNAQHRPDEPSASRPHHLRRFGADCEGHRLAALMRPPPTLGACALVPERMHAFTRARTTERTNEATRACNPPPPRPPLAAPH